MHSLRHYFTNPDLFKYSAILSSTISLITFITIVFVFDPFEEILSVFSLMIFLFFLIKLLCTLDWLLIFYNDKMIKQYEIFHYVVQGLCICYVGLVLLILAANVLIMMYTWNRIIILTLLLFVIDFAALFACCTLAYKRTKDICGSMKCRRHRYSPVPLIKHPVEDYSLKATIDLPFIPYYVPN